MSTVLQDLRYALRQLRRSPGFAVTAILTLALGIGANTAIFSLLDQALLRSLPVRDPQQLVVLKGTGKAWEGSTHFHGGDPEAYFSYPMYKDLRDHNQALEGLAATLPAEIGISHNGVAQLGRAELVSGNYFSMLGVQPALGRLLTPSEDVQLNSNPVAVLSFDFWKNHLGADPSLVGSTLSINGHPFQIVGVASPRFQSAVWGETPSLFVPITMLDQILPGAGKRLTLHTDRGINLIGRLKPGESRERAEVALAPLWHALRAEELKALGTRSPKFKAEFLTNSRLHVLPGAAVIPTSATTSNNLYWSSWAWPCWYCSSPRLTSPACCWFALLPERASSHYAMHSVLECDVSLASCCSKACCSASLVGSQAC